MNRIDFTITLRSDESTEDTLAFILKLFNEKKLGLNVIPKKKRHITLDHCPNPFLWKLQLTDHIILKNELHVYCRVSSPLNSDVTMEDLKTDINEGGDKYQIIVARECKKKCCRFGTVKNGNCSSSTCRKEVILLSVYIK